MVLGPRRNRVRRKARRISLLAVARRERQRWVGWTSRPRALSPKGQEEEDEEKSAHANADGEKENLIFRTGAAGFPRPRANAQRARISRLFGHAGDDAYASSPSMIAVADGVGAWRDKGIDAGHFAQTLVRAFADTTSLEEAFERTIKSGAQGSATFTGINLDGSKLRIVNLGDSGAIVVRGDKVLFRSSQQEHQFGWPYQVGHHDDSDAPRDAAVSEIPNCIPGDIVVAASDGLWDNLGEPDIVGIIDDQRKPAPPSQLARAIAAAALGNSLDREAATPYALAAQDAFSLSYWGGKPDDIVVVVGILE